MKSKMIYCHGEASEFPISEFLEDEQDAKKLHVPYVHNASTPHYWTGEEYEPRGSNGNYSIPVTLAAPENTL
jgi:hypothetical protein